jgi:mono/diheme cytochrome c family protein
MKRALTLIAAAIAASAQNPSAQKDDAGKNLYEVKACYQCHGWQGQGGLAGPRIAQTKLTLEGFRAILRNPPSSNMPPYREPSLSNDDLAKIFAYIQSFPAPKPAAEIPLLKY